MISMIFISLDSFDFSGKSACITSRQELFHCSLCHKHMKRGIRTVGAKNLKKYSKDAES